MNPRRTFQRCTTTALMVVSLLTSQLALASYVCPVTTAAGSMSEAMASGAPCEGMDAAEPVLCHRHAVDAAQSFEIAKLATPTLPVVVQVLVLPVRLDPAQAVALPFSGRAEIRPPPDPVFLQTLRLRV